MCLANNISGTWQQLQKIEVLFWFYLWLEWGFMLIVLGVSCGAGLSKAEEEEFWLGPSSYCVCAVTGWQELWRSLFCSLILACLVLQLLMVMCLATSLSWRCVLGILFHGTSLGWAMKLMFTQPTSMERHSKSGATGQMWPASSQPLLLQQIWSPGTLGDGCWAARSMITYKVRQRVEYVMDSVSSVFDVHDVQCVREQSWAWKNVPRWVGDALSCKIVVGWLLMCRAALVGVTCTMVWCLMFGTDENWDEAVP